MKNYLLGVLSILVIGLLSFNTIEEILTIKPAKPKEVVVQTVNESEIDSTVKYWVKKGFIIKQISNGGNRSQNTIVMEKY